jgi:hypothetical protein
MSGLLEEGQILGQPIGEEHQRQEVPKGTGRSANQNTENQLVKQTLRPIRLGLTKHQSFREREGGMRLGGLYEEPIVRNQNFDVER